MELLRPTTHFQPCKFTAIGTGTQRGLREIAPNGGNSLGELWELSGSIGTGTQRGLKEITPNGGNSLDEM
jgi:hypothetical protein